MTFNAVVVLVVAATFALSSANETTCSQLVNYGQNVADEDKVKAQLCHLSELADVLSGMASTLREAMVVLLNEQGVSVDDMYGNEIEKRGNEYLRFGKRKHEYLRFGKRKNEYLRFGK